MPSRIFRYLQKGDEMKKIGIGVLAVLAIAGIGIVAVANYNSKK